MDNKTFLIITTIVDILYLLWLFHKLYVHKKQDMIDELEFISMEYIIRELRDETGFYLRTEAMRTRMNVNVNVDIYTNHTLNAIFNRQSPRKKERLETKISSFMSETFKESYSEEELNIMIFMFSCFQPNCMKIEPDTIFCNIGNNLFII